MVYSYRLSARAFALHKLKLTANSAPVVADCGEMPLYSAKDQRGRGLSDRDGQ